MRSILLIWAVVQALMILGGWSILLIDKKKDKKRKTLDAFGTNLTNRAKDGKIDIIFGTHRLLSDDVNYKDFPSLRPEEEKDQDTKDATKEEVKEDIISEEEKKEQPKDLDLL